MNWFGLFLFAVACIAVGMALMDIIATKGRYEATTEAYKLGYEKGKHDEHERIGKLLDKYIEDVEKGAGENNKE